jgi:hypothetical protein
MLDETRGGHGREHGDPVLVALAAADDDLIGGEVDVLHAEPAALEVARMDGLADAVEEARPGRVGRRDSQTTGARDGRPPSGYASGASDPRSVMARALLSVRTRHLPLRCAFELHMIR